MKKTARVIITYKCNRQCHGCCNSQPQEIREISNIERLAGYEEVVLTGGEPMLNPKELMGFIKKLKKQNKNQRIYLYTACMELDEHMKLLNMLDGVTVTLHAEATDEDIRGLKYMSENLWGENVDLRLFIDERVYEKYNLSNIRMSTWDVVRKLKWKEKCEPAEHEDLLCFPI